MGDNNKPAPTSYLGDVYWCGDGLGNSLEYIVQNLLGMTPNPPQFEGWLDFEEYTAEEIERRSHYQETKDGRLCIWLDFEGGLTLPLAVVDTTFAYNDALGDDFPPEKFKQLIDEFVQHARSRPLVDKNIHEHEIPSEVLRNLPHESLEDYDFWTSLESWVREDCGLPHYLWIESLEFLEESEPGDWIPWPTELS